MKEIQILILESSQTRGHRTSVSARRGSSSLGLSLWSIRFGIVLLLACPVSTRAAPPDASFREGVEAYHAGSYGPAADAFRRSAAVHLAAGTLQNLGNAEWQSGSVGPAILAWEQSVWLNPFDGPARANLRFARKSAQLEEPELVWYEVVSTWLPNNWWAGLAGVSLWVAVGMITLPGIMRWKKATWHQAIAAFGLMVFLLTLPAHLGVHTRMRMGFVLQKSTPLRLTPTTEGQVVTRLAAGEPVRWESVRGPYVLVHAGSQALRGWIEREQFGQMCQR